LATSPSRTAPAATGLLTKFQLFGQCVPVPRQGRSTAIRLAAPPADSGPPVTRLRAGTGGAMFPRLHRAAPGNAIALRRPVHYTWFHRFGSVDLVPSPWSHGIGCVHASRVNTGCISVKASFRDAYLNPGVGSLKRILTGGLAVPVLASWLRENNSKAGHVSSLRMRRHNLGRQGAP